MINCLFCEKQRIDGYIHYPNLLRTALYLKYNPVDDQPIDDLLKHSHKKWVIDFYEKAQDTQDEEYIQKQYKNYEISQKLIDLTEYYKYRLDTPYLYMLPLCKLIRNHNKLRKEYHYTKIKYKLGLLTQIQKIDNIKQFTQILQDEESQSLISLLNKIQHKKSNIIKLNTQQSSLSTTKLYQKPLIRQSEQVSRKLKAILNGEIRSPPKKLPSKSQSILKFNTQNSTYKKMSIQQQSMQTIKKSSADIIKCGSQNSSIQKNYTNFLQMIILFALLLQVKTIYILHTKGISISKDDYFLITLTQDDYNEKSQISHKATFNISKQYNDSALFDIFILDQSGLDCYKQAYYNSSWETECFFLFNKSQTSLNNFQYSKDYTVEDALRYIIIDNTLFPQNGAYFADRLYVQLDYIQAIEPIPKYYQITIKITIVFVATLICFIIWGIILLVKYGKQKKIKKMIEKDKNNSTMSPLKSYR